MNNKKILLITPNLRGIIGGVNRIQPSLGVGYLAAVLAQKGYEVHVRDTALWGYERQVPLENKKMVEIGESEKAIASYISNLRPAIVGISVLFSNLIDHAHTIAKISKKVDPRIKVILGGNHITNAVLDYIFAATSGNKDYRIKWDPTDLRDKNIDFAMIGEADFRFPRLVEALLNKKDPYDIEGLVFRDGERIAVVRPELTQRVDIQKLPHPARHLMEMEKYFEIGLFHSTQSLSQRVYNIMASRGCPEKCSFCTTPSMWGSQIRWREPQDIYKEIKNGIERYNIGEVQFEDDSLTAHRSYLMELCDLIEPLKIPWCTPNGIKINYHLTKQPEVFRRMKEAGCYQVTFGCESGVQRVLDKIIGKNLQLEQIPLAIKNAKDAGLIVHSFWIVGYPGETRKEMEQTIEFAAQSRADSFSVAILTPLPGTAIYRQVVKKNLWWDSRGKKDGITYRNSLIKVDGFSGPEEFEAWVEEKNFFLNSLLEKNNSERGKMVAKVRGIAREKGFLKVKQT